MRIALGLIVLAACAADGPPQTPTTKGRCSALENKVFASLSQGECGLGPGGVALCTWHLTFTPHDATSTRFSWQHSDYGVDGDVACDADTITDVATSAVQGTFDDAAGQLTWQGVVYAPQ